MSFMKLPKCPYCGKELSYRETWEIRKYGDYDCDRCHQEYKIRYSKGVYLIVIGLLALEAFIFFSFDGIQGELSIFTLFLMVIPLILLYPLLPLMMSLRRKMGKGPHPGPPLRGQPDRRPARTRIYNPEFRTGQGYASGPIRHPGEQRPGRSPARPRMEPMAQRRQAVQNRPMERPIDGAAGQEFRDRPRPPVREGMARDGARSSEGREPVRKREMEERRRMSRPDGEPMYRERPMPPVRQARNARPSGGREGYPQSGQRPSSRRVATPAMQERAKMFFASMGQFFNKTGTVIATGAILAVTHIKTGALWVAGQVKAGAMGAVAALSGVGNAKKTSGRKMRENSPGERAGHGTPSRNRPEPSEHSSRRRPENRPGAPRRDQEEQGKNGRSRRPAEDRRRPEGGRGDRRMAEGRRETYQRPETGKIMDDMQNKDIARPEDDRKESEGMEENFDIMERLERDLESRSGEDRYRHSVSRTTAAQGSKRPPRYRDH